MDKSENGDRVPLTMLMAMLLIKIRYRQKNLRNMSQKNPLRSLREVQGCKYNCVTYAYRDVCSIYYTHSHMVLGTVDNE